MNKKLIFIKQKTIEEKKIKLDNPFLIKVIIEEHEEYYRLYTVTTPGSLHDLAVFGKGVNLTGSIGEDKILDIISEWRSTK